MSKQNLSTLSDIPEEKTTSVSADSLENESQLDEEPPGGSVANNGLDATRNSNAEFPSFNNILSSSHCDEASTSQLPASLVGSVETHHRHHHRHKVTTLFISEDNPATPRKSHAVHRYVEITDDDETEAHIYEKSFPTGPNSPRSKCKDKDSSNTSPPKTTNSDTNRAQGKTKAERHSRIPVAVRSLPVIARLRQSIEKQASVAGAPGETVPAANVCTDKPQQVTDKAPGAVERCRSHHSIDRPRKDFIQLNKHGEFRRTKTYHSLHLERRDGERSAPGSSVTAAGSAPGCSVTAAESATATRDAACTVDRQPASGAAGPPSPAGDPERQSEPTPGVRVSPRRPEPSSPAAGSEGSGGGGGIRRSSRIPVRAGPPTSPRRRHQSYEAPRSHASRRYCGVLDRDLTSTGRLEFHESRLSYDSSDSELAVPRLQLPHSQLSLIDVNDNRRLVSQQRRTDTLHHYRATQSAHGTDTMLTEQECAIIKPSKIADANQQFVLLGAYAMTKSAALCCLGEHRKLASGFSFLSAIYMQNGAEPQSSSYLLIFLYSLLKFNPRSFQPRPPNRVPPPPDRWW